MASSSSSSSDGSTWNKLADRMGKIRLRFEEISSHREALQLREGAVREIQNVADRQPSSHLPDTPTIFGRKKDMEEVISMLLSLADGGEKRTLSVLPIVGMGGVGKTTLVQHVYKNQRVQGHFPSRGWVCVSDDFAVVSLTKRIFESLTGEACQLNEFDAIQAKLIQKLKQGKRFLVVLDDVWNETSSFWDSLLKPFRLAGVEGSAVIVTTRIQSIARMMVETMPFRPLGCLSDYSCWKIFEENAFPGGVLADQTDLVQIGKKIVEKCQGLPLAVKVLGSLLRSEFDRDGWEEILQSEVWDVPKQHDEMIPALILSYHHLPSDLKPCFLYASVFPKDYILCKEQLVQLWMAQGFLQRKGSKQVEDIGNIYFDDLMERSLFSPVSGFAAKTGDCVMHDLIHDLARHISQGEISSCIGKEEVDKAVGGSKVRHLYVSHHWNKGNEWMLQYLCSDEARVIRSLLLDQSQGLRDVLPKFPIDDDEELKLPNEMILNIESLRSLELAYFRSKISELPDSMGYLRHLRYLNLKGNKGIRRLPETIGMLYNLQYLNLNYCDGLGSLPESIGGLCNLQHLTLCGCSNLGSLPESIGGLCKLQHLRLDHCKGLGSLPESIGGLCNLQHLNLGDCNGLRSLPENMGGLCNLQHLSLNYCYRLRSLPESMGGLCNLQHLNLTDCKSLGSLPESIRGLCNLQHLRLDHCNGLGSLPESIGGLCNLQHLNLGGCKGLRSLPESIGGLYNLQYLNLSCCTNFGSLPESIRGLCNLQHLSLYYCRGLISLPESIIGLCNLQHLTLDHCEDLRSLPESIRSLCNLQHLSLYGLGGLKSLPESIGGLCNLQHLSLNYCKGLGSLPESIGGLCNLQQLNLRDCEGLGSLPESIGGLCNLQDLNLTDCKGLGSLPESIGGLCNLQHLSLKACKGLGSLPESIRGLCKLQHLSLDGCKGLGSLPESIGGLRNLQHLSLKYCKGLGSLPESIGGLHNLQHLSLDRCYGLRSLPESMGGLCKLQHLSLDGCEGLGSLPESIGGLRNLQHLSLKDCEGLGSLPESMGGLCNLQHLSLDDCEGLGSLPESIGGLRNLQHLSLDRCYGLGSLPESIGGLCNLQCLAIVVNPEDAVTANLRNKEHITQLYLAWSGNNGDNGDDNEKAYRALENLRPPTGLQQLVILHYKGLRFPTRMGGDASSFSQLTCVQLGNCRRCTLLPPLGQLPSLYRLYIGDADNMERVGPEFRGVGFPALEELYFSGMPSWVTWDAAERGDFPRLRELRLFFCPKLQSMVPVYLFPALEVLVISNCGSLPSIELKMPLSSSSSMGPPPLEEMSICECPLARFSPEDDPHLLPDTLWYFSINSGCPLLSEWCWGDDGRRRLAHIPYVDIPELEIVSERNCCGTEL